MRTNFTVILVMILLSLGATAYSETGNASLNSNVSAIQPAYDSNVAKEVIADAPWLITTDTIPIMIMIRDADAADYDLGNVEVYQDSNCDRSNSLNGDVLLYNETRWNGQTINDNYFNLYRKGDWYGIIELNNSFGLNGLTCFHVIIRDIGGILDTDDDTHAFFNVTITDTRVPRSNNWYCGDTHYHTYASDNYWEFGAPIEASIKAAEAIGLDWFAITDHSFDIDDTRDGRISNNKWDYIKAELNNYLADTNVEVILGEEVSIRGIEKQNIGLESIYPTHHFLVYGLEDTNNLNNTDLDFVPGDDDGEKDLAPWNLTKILQVVQDNNLVAYAAHPAEFNDSENQLLKRGSWTETEYGAKGLDGLQIWNGVYSSNNDWRGYLQAGLNNWTKLLLNGSHIYISGGTDAHGDFSYYKYAAVGEHGAAKNDNNAFGRVLSCCYAPSLSRDNILSALRDGSCYVTNNGALKFGVGNSRGGVAMVGGSVGEPGWDLNVTVDYDVQNSCTLRVFAGYNGSERVMKDYGAVSGNGTKNFTSSLPSVGYYRVECISGDGGSRIYTNPIWVEYLPDKLQSVSGEHATLLTIREVKQ